jgi:hypothetical protein
MDLKVGDLICIKRKAVFELVNLITKSARHEKELWEVKQIGANFVERIWVYYDSVISIKSEITDNQIRIIRRSLGLESIHDRDLRNYFVANEKSDDFKDLEKLVVMGLMKRIETPCYLPDDSLLYCVTPAGKFFLKQ